MSTTKRGHRQDVPFVFVHGLIGSLQIPAVVSTFRRGIAPDLIGYGTNLQAPLEDIHLDAQVEHLLPYTPCHLLGHSVGGVIAMLLAHRYPDRILSLTSVEGNFTLNDAFMTSRIAAMSDLEADALLQQRRETPEAWLQSQGIDPLPGRIELARHWLNKQNGRTIVAMSRSVLNVTGHPSYLDKVREVFASPVPVHLIAGERSRAGWDVPDWALHEAASMTILPATGHMMMLEDPAAFAAAVRANVF